MVSLKDYEGTVEPAWCQGCGNFGILTALKRALVDLDIAPHQVLMVSGIGQAGKLPHYTKCHVLNELHGRAVPAAVGAKIANSDLVVIVVGGEGDGYGEGGNHFLHAVRRNHDMTYLVHNNQVYALTKGQTSPTSDLGFVTRTTPQGAPRPLNPLAVAMAGGGTFVARGFAGDVEHLSGLIKEAVRHRGFSLVDILQPCVSFNHKNTYAWYRERVYRLESDGHDPEDRAAAFEKAQEWGERIPIGAVYREESATFEDHLPALKRGLLVRASMDPGLVGPLLDEFV